MILLIGGSSHVGKTFFAQKLMEELHYPYLSLDHLKMAFIRTGRTDLTVEDDVEMRYFLWPFAAELIKTAVENGQNLIVEGCYIPENWRDSFEPSYLEKIRCVFLVMSEAYLRANFDTVRDYANVIEQRIDDRPDMERLIACSKGFLEDCIEYGIPYVEIDGTFDPDAILFKLRQNLLPENG
jgi:2-phosphoglycerate kinase